MADEQYDLAANSESQAIIITTMVRFTPPTPNQAAQQENDPRASSIQSYLESSFSTGDPEILMRIATFNGSNQLTLVVVQCSGHVPDIRAGVSATPPAAGGISRAGGLQHPGHLAVCHQQSSAVQPHHHHLNSSGACRQEPVMPKWVRRPTPLSCSSSVQGRPRWLEGSSSWRWSRPHACCPHASTGMLALQTRQDPRQSCTCEDDDAQIQRITEATNRCPQQGLV